MSQQWMNQLWVRPGLDDDDSSLVHLVYLPNKAPISLHCIFPSSHERTEPHFFRSDLSVVTVSLLIVLSDPFADEGDPLGDSQDVGSQADYIHIRIQQRNGRKTLTTLQGLSEGN